MKKIRENNQAFGEFTLGTTSEGDFVVCGRCKKYLLLQAEGFKTYEQAAEYTRKNLMKEGGKLTY